MIILSDTDIVHKLACCELLLDFLQYLKCPPNEVWVLPPLRQMLRRKLANAPEAAKNVDQFLMRVRRIPAANVETLERFSTLDIGEQQLLAVLCDDPRVKHMVTGDKRALDRIAALTFGDELLKQRLEDASFFCFEAVMLGLLKKRGFSIIQARVLNKWAKLKGQQFDGVILKAFPVGGTADLATQVLTEHLAQLRAALPPLQFETVQ
jgi:hypothetical protein